MATEINQPHENEALAQPKTWFGGSWRNGEFWCDCEPRRRATRLETKSGPNIGRLCIHPCIFAIIYKLTRELVWRCPKRKDDHTQCPFFIWVDQEAEAKEWFANNGPQEAPETPSNKDNPPGSKSLECPWMGTKRKPASTEVSVKNENGGPSNPKVDNREVFDGGDEGMESPSRKAVKTKQFSTPSGKTLNERLREAALPTPDSGDKGKAKAVELGPIQAENKSPTPGRSKDAPYPDRGGMTDLTTNVLKLLRDEKFNLKESTELQIRHEIDLELDLNVAKVKRYKDTVSKLTKRLGVLEAMLLRLTGDASLDKPIELSD
jgi:hypothetical protein